MGWGVCCGCVGREERQFSGCGQLGASIILRCRVRQLKLVLGLHQLHNPRDPGLTFYIKEAVKHPGYNSHTYENDLALLKVRNKG